MSIKPINSLFRSKTNFRKNNKQQRENPIQEAGRNKKKTALIMGGIASLAVAGTVAAVAIKKHEVPNEIKTTLNNFNSTNKSVSSLTKSIQKQANEVVENAQKLFNEITELYKKGDEIAPDGTVLRKITGNDRVKIMEEFTQDGKITRKSAFVVDTLNNVQEGIEEFNNGTNKVAKEISFFEDGQINWYIEDHVEFADGSWKSAKEMDFQDKKLSRYAEGYKKSPEHKLTTAKEIYFKDDKPISYIEDNEIFDDGSAKIGKVLYFENGKPTSYLEEHERHAENKIVIANSIRFNNGKPVIYQNNCQILFENKKLILCNNEYEPPEDKIEKAAKEYTLTKKGYWKETTK